jgi:hypothetical protein
MHALIVEWLSKQATHELRHMQRALETQNGLREKPPVDHFLISREERAALPGSNENTPEQIFVSNDAEDPRMGVFIDQQTLERFAARKDMRDPSALHDYCVVAEGVSHFLVLADRADAERQVSLLELELQAEVDKFVHLTQKLALVPGSRAQAKLHERLFERYALHAHLDETEVERYETANKAAARFCFRISKNAKRFYEEARDFFGLPLEAKIRRAA